MDETSQTPKSTKPSSKNSTTYIVIGIIVLIIIIAAGVYAFSSKKAATNTTSTAPITSLKSTTISQTNATNIICSACLKESQVLGIFNNTTASTENASFLSSDNTTALIQSLPPYIITNLTPSSSGFLEFSNQPSLQVRQTAIELLFKTSAPVQFIKYSMTNSTTKITYHNGTISGFNYSYNSSYTYNNTPIYGEDIILHNDSYVTYVAVFASQKLAPVNSTMEEIISAIRNSSK
jgi:flagellar basal body-associated protein FliL